MSTDRILFPATTFGRRGFLAGLAALAVVPFALGEETSVRAVGGGFANFGRGTPAMLHGGETVYALQRLQHLQHLQHMQTARLWNGAVWVPSAAPIGR